MLKNTTPIYNKLIAMYFASLYFNHRALIFYAECSTRNKFHFSRHAQCVRVIVDVTMLCDEFDYDYIYSLIQCLN